MRRPKSGASPWIARNTLVEQMQDPEEYYHTRVLQNTRRFLLRAQNAEVDTFLQAMHEHDGSFNATHGPVGVLERTLNRLGWTTTPDGHLNTDRLIRINNAAAIPRWRPTTASRRWWPPSSRVKTPPSRGCRPPRRTPVVSFRGCEGGMETSQLWSCV